jgi:hypothetical protein
MIRCEIYDLQGKQISIIKGKEYCNKENTIRWSVEDHIRSKGVYLISLQTNRGSIVKKLIVN